MEAKQKQPGDIPSKVKKMTKKEPKDPWHRILHQRAVQPDLYEWRYRLAVTEVMLREMHPQRESIG